MTVLENLQMGAYSRKDKDGLPDDYQRVFELFPRLDERRSQHGGTLSGGEQQMLAIGRALMTRPKLLLLDEPSMGLAPILVEQIFAIIQDINRQGTTILLVEQNAAMALGVADRGYVLQTGRIVRAGEAKDAPRGRGGQEGVPGRLSRAATARLSERASRARRDPSRGLVIVRVSRPADGDGEVARDRDARHLAPRERRHPRLLRPVLAVG